MIAIVTRERLIFARQSQQAANDQRAYDKTMEKHRRVKQNVEMPCETLKMMLPDAYWLKR